MSIIAALGTTQVHNTGNGYQWQSIATDVSAFGTLSISAYVDQNSTVQLEFSKDGSTWGHTTTYAVTASVAYHVQTPVCDQYCRITSATSALTTTINHLTVRGLDSVHDLMEADVDSIAAHLYAGASGVALTDTVAGRLDVTTQARGHASDSITARCQDGTGNALVVAGGELAVADATSAGHLASIEADTTSIDAKTPALGIAVAASSLPVVLASDTTALPTQVAGAHANAWSAAAVLAAGDSAVVDLQHTAHLSIFGNADSATTITCHWSQDNVNFYEDAGTQAVLGGPSDFAIHLTAGAPYLRLRSSGAAAITVTVAGKA